MLKESIKVATVGHEFTTLVGEDVRVPIYPGADEIAMLLSMRTWILVDAADAWRRIEWILWRKSDLGFGDDVEPAAIQTLAYDVLTGGAFWHELSDANGGGSSAMMNDDQHFPEPGLPLIRPPQLSVRSTQAVAMQIAFHFYYRLIKVGRSELAKLMVKDKGRP